MATDSQAPGGRRKPFPKTFGDVMKNIPSGQGSDKGKRRADDAGEDSAAEKHRRETRGDGGQKRVGPVIIRKPSLQLGRTASSGASAASASPETISGTAFSAPSGDVQAAADSHADASSQSAETGHRAAVSSSADRRSPRRDKRAPSDRRSGGNAQFRPMAMPTQDEIDRRLASMPPAEDEDFAALFAASGADGQSVRRFEVGEKVSGQIVQMTGERAFLDLGGKGEGMIELSELKDKDGNVTHAVGDTVEAYVLKTGGGIVLTRAIPKGAQRDFILQAKESGIPVEGTVTAVNKGGFEIDLGSGMRAFCPVSQIDDRYVEDPTAFVGQRLAFRVSEVKERDIVLSRRALLAEEKAARAAALRDSIVPGACMDGVVTSVRDFGAFVDLGGIEGLVHVSELSFGRVASAADVLSVGQKVRVEVLRVEPPKAGDKGSGRISLSMKSLMDDPWETAAAAMSEGDRVQGKVVRLQPFGAFVELAPGVDGLIHISALGADRRIAHPKEVVSEGETVDCIIEDIDREARRIALRRLTGDENPDVSPAAGGAEEADSASTAADAVSLAVGDSVDVTVDKVEPFGLFVTFQGGRGLIPAAETGTPRGTDLRKAFPVGTTFRAELLERDGQGRLRLSKTAAEKSEERREVERYLKAENASAKKGFGTFADLFGKLKK